LQKNQYTKKGIKMTLARTILNKLKLNEN